MLILANKNISSKNEVFPKRVLIKKVVNTIL